MRLQDDLRVMLVMLEYWRKSISFLGAHELRPQTKTDMPWNKEITDL